MFEVTATATAGSEELYSRVWSNLEKAGVVDHLEDKMISALAKMNALSSDVGHGRAPKPATTNPVEVVFTMLVTENGAKWAKATFEWPNMGIEQQQMMLGILNGELSTVDSAVKDNEVKGKAKGKK